MVRGFYKEGEAPEELSIYEIVREAILSKQPIHAFYDGYERYMCPRNWNKERSAAMLILSIWR
jgi:hypothetical protein